MGSIRNWMLGAAVVAGGLGLGATTAQAAQIGIYVRGPVAYVPPCPGPGYTWSAGYMSVAIGFRGVGTSLAFETAMIATPMSIATTTFLTAAGTSIGTRIAIMIEAGNASAGNSPLRPPQLLLREELFFWEAKCSILSSLVARFFQFHRNFTPRLLFKCTVAG